MQQRKFSKSPRHFVRRPTGYRPDFRLYEDLKARYITANPQATSEQYEKAIREIAKRCGI
jgi:t-SNARE complex subunit (syntaxin)